MSDAVSTEVPKTPYIQQRSSALSLTHSDFSSFSESFDDVMHCRWCNLQSLLFLKYSTNFLRTLSQIVERFPSLLLRDSASLRHPFIANHVTDLSVNLKGSYDVAKNNIIWCTWCNAMRLRGSWLKKHYFPHTVHYCCSSVLRLSEMHRFLQSSSFWEARRALIDQLSGTLWLAEYLKHKMEMLRPSQYCDAVSQRDEAKTVKPITNRAFVAYSGDIITDYNDLYLY